MLTEIYCDKFMDEGVVRDPIRFHRGLNVVVGGDDASNSIGKTTFLLAIDFALGGKAYAKKSSSMIKKIGHHKIYFTHTFDGVDYRFCRPTADLKTVWRCNENRDIVGSLSADAFRDWLAAKYDLGELGSSFRDLQSPFFRAYGLKHDDVDRPLMSVSNDRVSLDLLRLLRLYGHYDEVAEIEERKENLDQDKKAFQNASSRKFIRGAESRDEYDNNVRMIGRLESQMKQILESCDKGTVSIDVEKESYLATLTEELVALKRSRASLERSLRAMERDLELVNFKTTKDFEKLSRFFPEIDIKPIEEIEAFHAENVKNLKEQHRAEAADMRARIVDLSAQIDRVESSIQEAGSISSLPRTAVEEYADLNSLVEQLTRANELYDRNKQFSIEAKEIRERREAIEMGYFGEIQARINSELETLNFQATGGEVTAPRIVIKDPDHYDFEVPFDDGTGSRNRGMFLFDVALLNQTPLQFAIHDSPGLKQVEDGHTIGMFEIYSKVSKQVFVAIDKASKYTESGEVPAVITGNTVLKLDRGHELFGEAWNRQQEKEIDDTEGD